jgi:superoxide oxidase
LHRVGGREWPLSCITLPRMKSKSVRTRYAGPLIGLHWLMFLLIAVVYATAELSEAFPKGSAGRSTLRAGHEMLGLLVFGAVWLRLLARALSATPPIQPAPPPWQARIATVAHLALYGLMIVLPFSGWLMLSAAGKPVPFFGWELPGLVAPNRSLAEALEEVHEVIASAGYALIGLHAAAALFHHYLLRDNTLRLMWPALRAAR